MHKSNHQRLYEFVAKYKAHIVPMIPHCIEQVGDNCKIYAAYNLSAMYALTNTDQLPPHPPRSRESLINLPDSMRRYAKKKLHSTVGEIYDPQSLVALLAYNNVTAKAQQILDKECYIREIKRRLDRGQPLIAFCDVDDKHLVGLKAGKREHAIVIIGYCQQQGQDYFIFLSWGGIFTVPANKLADSTHQLENPRESEYYIKHSPGIWINTTADMPGNVKTSNQNRSSLQNYLVFADEDILDERDTPAFINHKTKILNHMHTWIKGDHAQEFKRRLDLCLNTTQLNNTLHYFCAYGLGQNTELKNYLLNSSLFAAKPQPLCILDDFGPQRLVVFEEQANHPTPIGTP